MLLSKCGGRVCHKIVKFGLWDKLQIHTTMGSLSRTKCNQCNSTNVFFVFLFLTDTDLYSLWAHEWTKHGTCAAQLQKFNSELKYFSMGLELSKQYSLNEILQKNDIVPSNTIQYTIVDINNAIKGELGADPVISCKKEDGGVSYISDVRICLTKDLKPANCDGIVARTDFDGQSILTSCNKAKDITYPHYVGNNYLTIQLYRLISWLQWFTL